MSKPNGKWSGVSAHFTYEYPSWNQRLGKPLGIAVQNECARLDFLEQEIQNMLTYPDAERIINKIRKENN